MSEPQLNNKKYIFRLVLSLIGITLGLLAFITFFCMKNYFAGLWAFMSFLYAALCFNMHYYASKNKIHEVHDTETLDQTQFFAVIGTTIGCAGCIWHLFQILYYDEGVLPVSKSVPIQLVWAFMTTKWAFICTIYSQRYKKYLTNLSQES